MGTKLEKYLDRVFGSPNEDAFSFKVSVSRIKEYFKEHEDLFKLIGVSIAITGLFLNLGTQNQYLRRIEVFFLLITCGLISWFMVKSLHYILRGNHSKLYDSFVAIPLFFGGTLIYNLWRYIADEFSSELWFYLHSIGIPIIGLVVNLAFIGFSRAILRFKKIEVQNFEQFFLVFLNIYLVGIYVFTGSDFSNMLDKVFSFDFSHFFLIYVFLLSLLVEFEDYKALSKGRKIINFFLYAFLIAFPHLIKFFSEELVHWSSLWF